ncbi:MAG: sugar transferase, partial [Actinomycetota bacterium]|nr:sugar transferase [Actinomycetota bacterium]
FLHLTVGMAFLFYAANVSVARGFVFPALVLALLLDLVGRYAARKFLHRRRRNGASMTAVIAIGGGASVAQFTALLRRDRHAGLDVVGACLPDDAADIETVTRDLAAAGIPVLGSVDTILEAVHHHGANTVAVLSGEISAEKLRWISWQLEGTSVELVVSPGLAEIGGRRLHIQPVAGLPLLHIEEPEFAGFRRMIKRGFDIVLSVLALTVLAPVLLIIGLLVRLTSRGPALFTQTRIGLHGREFRVMKFRSMCHDAEQQKVELLTTNEAGGVLFKMRADPRVTRIGRTLRRFSLDELPQLINVLRGSMSLVGPRPPLPDEVAKYRDDVRRRLLVKPGLTGLWQISGRSDLSWEESIRLDLRYVEDWSLSLDLLVLWKTARAVMSADGAY